MLASAVFGAAPRALAGVITLQQTVDLVKLSIEVVESNIDDIVDPDDAVDAHAAVLRYAREVAFATAEVYARAAEVRGAWDARLEALVVDSVLRGEADEAVLSRASALGWSGHGAVSVVLGEAPGRRADTDVFEEVRRVARAAGQDALCATQGDRLVVLLGGTGHGDGPVAPALLDLFGPGPVVVGPGGRRPRARAPLRPRRARRRTAPPPAGRTRPRPVRSSELLPERVLAGDGHARRHLVEEVYLPLTRRAGHPRRDAGDLPRDRVVDRGHRPGALRAPQHRALPAAAGRRPHRLQPRPSRARRSRCTSPWCWAASPGATIRCRNPTKTTGWDSCVPEAHGRARSPAEWVPCSSSSRPARAPRPPAS